MSLTLTKLFRSLRQLTRPAPAVRNRTTTRGATRPMLEHQVRELRQQLAPGQDVFIFLPTAPWRALANSRPQSLARELAARGNVVLFDCSGTLADGIGLREVESHLYLYSGPTRYLADWPNVILWVTLDNVMQRLRYPAASRVVYHWTENADVLRRIHEDAFRSADVVVTSLPGVPASEHVIAAKSEGEQVRELLERLQHQSVTASEIG